MRRERNQLVSNQDPGLQQSWDSPTALGWKKRPACDISHDISTTRTVCIAGHHPYCIYNNLPTLLCSVSCQIWQADLEGWGGWQRAVVKELEMGAQLRSSFTHSGLCGVLQQQHHRLQAPTASVGFARPKFFLVKERFACFEIQGVTLLCVRVIISLLKATDG